MHLRHLFELQNFNIDQKIWVIKISPNGEYLAAGGPSGVLKIFEIFNSEPSNYKQSYTSHDISKYLNFMNEIAFRVYTEHTNDIIDICWSPRVNYS
jgi:WD40 repeat protein